MNPATPEALTPALVSLETAAAAAFVDQTFPPPSTATLIGTARPPTEYPLELKEDPLLERRSSALRVKL